MHFNFFSATATAQIPAVINNSQALDNKAEAKSGNAQNQLSFHRSFFFGPGFAIGPGYLCCRTECIRPCESAASQRRTALI